MCLVLLPMSLNYMRNNQPLSISKGIKTQNNTFVTILRTLFHSIYKQIEYK